MPCESAAASCAEPRRRIRQGGDRDPGSERGETAACEDPWHERSGERDGSFGCGPRSGWERDGALPGDGGERARSASDRGVENQRRSRDPELQLQPRALLALRAGRREGQATPWTEQSRGRGLDRPVEAALRNPWLAGAVDHRRLDVARLHPADELGRARARPPRVAGDARRSREVMSPCALSLPSPPFFWGSRPQSPPARPTRVRPVSYTHLTLPTIYSV